MSEIIDRLRAETPIFFRRVREFGLYLMATSAALLLAPDGIHIPELVVELAKYAGTTGFIISTIASFAKKDPNQL